MEDSVLETLKDVIPDVVNGWDGHSIRIEMERVKQPNGSYERTFNVDLANKPTSGNFSVPYAVLELDYETDEVRVKYWKDQK